jgi:hypothetical protein
MDPKKHATPNKAKHEAIPRCVSIEGNIKLTSAVETQFEKDTTDMNSSDKYKPQKF